MKTFRIHRGMRLPYRVIDIGPKFHSLMYRLEVRLDIPYLATNPAETVPRNYVGMGSFQAFFEAVSFSKEVNTRVATNGRPITDPMPQMLSGPVSVPR